LIDLSISDISKVLTKSENCSSNIWYYWTHFTLKCLGSIQIKVDILEHIFVPVSSQFCRKKMRKILSREILAHHANYITGEQLLKNNFWNKSHECPKGYFIIIYLNYYATLNNIHHQISLSYLLFLIYAKFKFLIHFQGSWNEYWLSQHFCRRSINCRF